MNIIVLIKQVPETGNVKMDENTGTMIRDGVESIINPLDLYAIEASLQLREQHGGAVTAISMGPPSCQKALREAIAMGCDDAVQISHKAFAGADTWATSYVLSKAIAQNKGDFDLILCGERATDGDTGQVGPGVAAHLQLPLITYASKIEPAETPNRFQVERLVEGGYEVLSCPLPVLLTVVKEISFPRLPTLRGKQRAKTLEVPVLAPENLSVKDECIGLKGSPTQVVKIFRPKVSREGEKYTIKDEADLERAVDRLLDFLEEKQLI